ncbi:hypothetical protein BHE74_00008712 [Ensete ventricosum]|nr:hypothetical protein GW17_00026636 [Ensete ventricosum]RWW82789.1 hypothetical protein BHE74_00008712 [Ensete ventricosum]
MGADRALWVLSITLFTISGKGLYYPTNTRVQKDMSNKTTYIGSTCETMKYTCANMKQYDLLVWHM